MFKQLLWACWSTSFLREITISPICTTYLKRKVPSLSLAIYSSLRRLSYLWLSVVIPGISDLPPPLIPTGFCQNKMDYSSWIAAAVLEIFNFLAGPVNPLLGLFLTICDNEFDCCCPSSHTPVTKSTILYYYYYVLSLELASKSPQKMRVILWQRHLGCN